MPPGALQLRFVAAGTPERGLFLLSCHEGKAKADFVVLPFLSNRTSAMTKSHASFCMCLCRGHGNGSWYALLVDKHPRSASGSGWSSQSDARLDAADRFRFAKTS